MMSQEGTVTVMLRDLTSPLKKLVPINKKETFSRVVNISEVQPRSIVTLLS